MLDTNALGLICGIVAIIFGIACFKWPEFFWKINKYSDGGSPSKYFINKKKATGIFSIIGGIFMIILSILLFINKK